MVITGSLIRTSIVDLFAGAEHENPRHLWTPVTACPTPGAGRDPFLFAEPKMICFTRSAHSGIDRGKAAGKRAPICLAYSNMASKDEDFLRLMTSCRWRSCPPSPKGRQTRPWVTSGVVSWSSCDTRVPSANCGCLNQRVPIPSGRETWFVDAAASSRSIPWIVLQPGTMEISRFHPQRRTAVRVEESVS
jgi:hypothetical protein